MAWDAVDTGSGEWGYSKIWLNVMLGHSWISFIDDESS